MNFFFIFELWLIEINTYKQHLWQFQTLIIKWPIRVRGVVGLGIALGLASGLGLG